MKQSGMRTNCDVVGVFTRNSPVPGAGDRSQAPEPRAHHLVLHASGHLTIPGVRLSSPCHSY
jgi:hypothetical protein